MVSEPVVDYKRTAARGRYHRRSASMPGSWPGFGMAEMDGDAFSPPRPRPPPPPPQRRSSVSYKDLDAYKLLQAIRHSDKSLLPSVLEDLANRVWALGRNPDFMARSTADQAKALYVLLYKEPQDETTDTVREMLEPLLTRIGAGRSVGFSGEVRLREFTRDEGEFEAVVRARPEHADDDAQEMREMHPPRPAATTTTTTTSSSSSSSSNSSYGASSRTMATIGLLILAILFTSYQIWPFQTQPQQPLLSTNPVLQMTPHTTAEMLRLRDRSLNPWTLFITHRASHQHSLHLGACTARYILHTTDSSDPSSSHSVPPSYTEGEEEHKGTQHCGDWTHTISNLLARPFPPTIPHTTLLLPLSRCLDRKSHLANAFLTDLEFHLAQVRSSHARLTTLKLLSLPHSSTSPDGKIITSTPPADLEPSLRTESQRLARSVAHIVYTVSRTLRALGDESRVCEALWVDLKAQAPIPPPSSSSSSSSTSPPPPPHDSSRTVALRNLRAGCLSWEVVLSLRELEDAVWEWGGEGVETWLGRASVEEVREVLGGLEGVLGEVRVGRSGGRE
ncbi:hypothetical protein Tdes44962_MAKER06319 [Teratosphaeria destructans]|uniref:Uncharacterized protein n=1 Tax=Teratosphaeria destructans TaxID=418781 RepID=A0A9W7SI88_9PEZI|nr:hypothetical protein Tdes44962_MAKER06319 [Teratosphaeria destructans]